MFFTEDREHFFRPLNGKYRGQVLDCLSTFYARLYGSLADYSRSFNREQVIEILEEAIARSPVLDEDESEVYQTPVRSQREQANWILNQLLEYGWLERQMDEATMQSTYAFTRHGRLFTQPMVEAAGGRFRTRHRNTRNTRNALQSFLDKGEVYDLLDAFEYSERIISDFSDVIAELDERKRQLVREVEAQQVVQRASDEFFDFMEKRFMPDLSIRLSADSVEKYRDEISELIGKARRKRREFKAQAERELRRVAPELIEHISRSVYLLILDGIETRMHNASAIMLPALRQALNGFTRRADIIMRQLSYTGASGQNRLFALCEQLRQASEADQTKALSGVGKVLSVMDMGFVDPDSIRLHQGRRLRLVNTAVEEEPGDDRASRKALFVQTAVDLAFTFNSQGQRDYLVQALCEGHRIKSQQLPVRDARELLMSAHAIEVGALGDGEFAFRVTPTDNRVGSEYFHACDEFTIELIERETHAERSTG
ncbi:Wadjet anti-phage system protein JetA family protein [Sedimenticola selenatireducens]|uniref:Flagellar protein FliT n=1 Tax=Sedimenticola selenatireducens TaxID=191960 RepID=A0A2N6CRF7_9GAMM|nr:Wadjet anti-phage system protein JetA family protein [Sedimenticola selenatireducens]PLX59653.1 MAG: flagellar protein FliT [Sedimenticola selenatireducens]